MDFKEITEDVELLKLSDKKFIEWFLYCYYSKVNKRRLTAYAWNRINTIMFNDVKRFK